MRKIIGNPVLVTGMENSGTRVAVWYLQSLGIDVGLSSQLENEMSWKPVDGFVRRYFFDYFNGNLENLEELFFARIAEHPMSSSVWAFKSARAIYMIDFMLRCIPRLKVIHVIRDGRDISKKFVEFAYSDATIANIIPVDGYNFFNSFDAYLYIWNHLNLLVEKLVPKENRFMMRLEDMVDEKRRLSLMVGLIDFLGLEEHKGRKDFDVFYKLTVPGSIGRHKSEGRVFPNKCLSFLKSFGYD